MAGMEPPGAYPPPDYPPTPADLQLEVPHAAPSPEYGASPQLVPQQTPEFVPASGEPPALGPTESLEYGSVAPVHDVYAHQPPQPMAPRRPIEPSMAQAVGEIENEQAHSLGLSMLAMAVGIAVGARQGGLTGAAAGSLIAGAAVNGWRAFSYYQKGTEKDDTEGRISLIYGLIAGAGGAFVWSKYVSKGQAITANPSHDRTDDEPFGASGACDIRPVGP